MICGKCLHGLPPPEAPASTPSGTSSETETTPAPLIPTPEKERPVRRRDPGSERRLIALLLALLLALIVYLQFPVVDRTWEAAVGNLRELVESSGIGGIGFSRDREYLATAGRDGTLQIRDPLTGRIKRTLRPGVGGTQALAINSSGSLIALAPLSRPGSIRLLSLQTGKVARELRDPAGKVLWHGVAFSPTGGLLAGAGKRLILWDAATGAAVRTLPFPGPSVNSVAFSPNGRLLAACSAGREIRIWDVKSGKLMRSIKPRDVTVESVAFGAGGKTLASGGSAVLIWDVKSGTQVRELARVPGERLVVFSHDGKLLATASAERVRLWEAETGKLRGRLAGGPGWLDGSVTKRTVELTAVAFSIEGGTLASGWALTNPGGNPGGAGGVLRLWRVR